MVGDGHAMGVAAARLREHCNDHRLHPVPSDPDCIACGGCTLIVQFPARTLGERYVRLCANTKTF